MKRNRKNEKMKELCSTDTPETSTPKGGLHPIHELLQETEKP